MDDFVPTPEQAAAIDKIRAWLLDPKRKPVFRLFGFAGTGKTSIARHIGDNFNGAVHFLAYTGKAALRLREKKCLNARTIHKFLYDPIDEVEVKVDGVIVYKPIFEAKLTQLDLDLKIEPAFAMACGNQLIVLDECSMVNEEVAKDLLACKIPIIVLGDPGQLPPVEGRGGYFIDSAEYPIGKPDVQLQCVQRQAADSPIIHIATLARQMKRIPFGDIPCKVCGGTVDADPDACGGDGGKRHGAVRVVTFSKFNESSIDTESDDTQVICGTHRMRNAFNKRTRDRLGMGDCLLGPGERVICYRNRYEHVLNRNGDLVEVPVVFNGETFRVLAVEPSNRGDEFIHVTLDRECSVIMEEMKKVISCTAWKRILHGERIDAMRFADRSVADEFDYAWSITCHKAQGSEWDNVIVFDEAGAFKEDAVKWRYTAYTRAARRLTVVI